MLPIYTATIALYGPPILMALAGLWLLWRMLRLKQKSGISVLVHGRQKPTATEIWLIATGAVLDCYLLLRPFFPGLDDMVYTAPSPFGHFGVVLMVIGLGIMVLAQAHMGRAWRVGVPQVAEETQELVTSGPYRFSRNPIYLGIMLFALGAIIVAPGPLTIIAAAMLWGGMNALIAHEESFMERTFGEAYAAYRATVRRWL